MLSSQSRYALSVVAIASGLLAFAGSASSAELTFWSMWTEPEPQAQALKTIMAAYTKAHPQTTFKAVWNGRQNQTKLRGALQAGTSVDFMDQDSDQLAGGIQKQGLAYELDGQMDDAFKSVILPGVFDLYSNDGKHYQMPYIYNTVNFWYSKEMMKEARAEPPKTWADLLAVCKAVKAIGKHALVVEGDNVDYNTFFFSHLLERLRGPDAMVRLFEDKTGPSWADPAVLAAAKMERELWDADCIAGDARGLKYPAGQQGIALGETMGELVGSWLPVELKDSTGDDFAWGAFNFPSVPGGIGKSTDMEVALLSMAVLKNSPNAKEAVSFMKYLMSEEAQKVLVQAGGVGVTRRDVAWPATLTDAYAAASEATSLTSRDGGLNIKYADFATTVLGPEHNKMFLGTTTPEQFVATLIAKTKEYRRLNP